MSETADAIRVERLSKSYGSLKAVDDLSFSAARGKCTAFLGPNGAGKTTTIKVLYGKARFDPSPSTRVEVLGFGMPGRELEVKARTGLVPQDNSLDEQLDVGTNLYVFSKLYGMRPERARARIAELLEFMELSDKAASRVRELSGGMKRRLVIARALLGSPELLILDEPTTGLDPQVRHHIWDKLRELMRRGVTVLLTTHYMDEAWQIADEIVILDKGRKALQGNPRELMESRMERLVLEIHGLEEGIPELVSDERLRVESSPGRVLVYSSEEDALARIMAALSPGSYVRRHAHLEDLFLRVTGRSIDE